MNRGCFVTGTDTGVGKTVVATAIVRGLRARGIDAVGMKPVETGVPAEGPADGIALREAANGVLALEAVNPSRYPLPAAPAVAAAAGARRIDVGSLRANVASLCARHEYVVVEGAGGLLVPLDDETDMVDFAQSLGLPLVIVARTRLGTINHTRLTLEVAQTRGLEVAGVVLSDADGVLSEADAANLAWLREWLGPRCLCHLEPLAPGERLALDAAVLDRLSSAANPPHPLARR